MNRKYWLKNPLVLFWVITTFIFFFLHKKQVFENAGINGKVLLAGNFVLFIVSLLSYLVIRRSVSTVNPQAAVRPVYISFIFKFFIVAITAFTYIMVAKKEVNKPALLGCAVLYIIYTTFEVTSLTGLLKKKNG
jgi:hypothetical protein